MKRVLPALLLLGACTSPAPDHVSQPVQYERVNPAYPDVATCLELREEWYDTCTQTVELCPDGTVALQLSDAVMTGSYWIYDTEITTSIDLASDPLIFAIRDNGALVSDELDPRPFERTGNAALRCALPL